MVMPQLPGVVGEGGRSYPHIIAFVHTLSLGHQKRSHGQVAVFGGGGGANSSMRCGFGVPNPVTRSNPGAALVATPAVQLGAAGEPPFVILWKFW